MLIEAIVIILAIMIWFIMARKFDKIGSLVLKMFQPFRKDKLENIKKGVDEEDEKNK